MSDDPKSLVRRGYDAVSYAYRADEVDEATQRQYAAWVGMLDPILPRGGKVLELGCGCRGWINYLATAPEKRRCGIGHALMQKVEHLLKGAGCPKINLQVRATNREVIEFYRAVGFDVDEVVSMGKRLEQD